MALTVVTGASGGIGTALAAELAAPGETIGLVGRNPAGLAAAEAAVRDRGATPRIGALDLTAGAFAEWLAEAARGERLAALYANAGLSAGPPSPAALESAADTERLIATNLTATIAAVREAVAVMRAQPAAGLRHITIVASVAGLLPSADLAVYGATKAGLINYAHAIRPRLKRDGIIVTVACPGFVTSPMSARHKGAKPFEIGPDVAARKIVAATRRGRRTTVFPLAFAALAYGAPLAPGPLIDALAPLFAATIEPDPREAERD